MRRTITLITAALLALAAFTQDIDLREKYGLSPWASEALGKTYTVQQAKVKYPAFFSWMAFKGATDAEAMTVNEVAAAWNDAVWSTDGYIEPYRQGAWPQNGCQSRANIDASGIYFAKVNVPLTLAFGIYTGGGTGNYTETTTANGGPATTGGTRLMLDHAAWLTRIFKDRNLMQSITWGDNSLMGYHESFLVRGFRLEGGMDGKKHDPAFQSSGIAIWDSGETSRVEHCFISNFNDAGIHNVRGTPSIFDGVSCFSNRRFGFWLDGGSLSTIAIYSPSGDDNGPGDGNKGALVGGTEGYGRAAGGTVVVVAAKSETNNVQGRMNGSQRLMSLDAGAWNVVVTGAWAYSQDAQAEAIAIDFGTYNGQLDVRGLSTHNFPITAKVTAKGSVVATVGGFGNVTPVSFVATGAGLVWSSRGGPVTPPPPPPPTGCDRAKWTATANVSGGGTTPGAAIDGDAGTAWTTGRAQQARDHIDVDIGGCEISSVEFTTGKVGEYPVKYAIDISADGTTWMRVASGRGSAQQAAYTAGFDTQRVRSIRLRLTSGGTTPLSVAEVSVR